MDKPIITVDFAGPGGNAFAIIRTARRALKDAGWDDVDIREYVHKATAGNYENLVAVTGEYVDIVEF